MILTNAERIETFVAIEQLVLTYPEVINVNAMRDLLVRLHVCHVKNLVLTFSVGRMHIVKSKKMKRFVFAKKVGLSYPLIFPKVVWILMSAITLMDRLACVELTQSVTIPKEDTNAHAKKASKETLMSSAWTSMNALKMSAEKMLIA